MPEDLPTLKEHLIRLTKELLETVEAIETLKGSEELAEFLKEPWYLLPRGDRYWVIVPKFVDFQVGWLHHETATYRVFVIDQYTAWLTDIPEEIRREIRLPKPLDVYVEDGYLRGDSEALKKAWKKYRQLLSRREGDRIRVKRGREFELIAKLIEDGTLPFRPHPVDEKDLRPFDAIELRPHQQKAWNAFLEWGAVGVFMPFGSGKSFLGLYALGRLKGKKLVVVPTKTLKEQWEERLSRYGIEDVKVVTYHYAVRKGHHARDRYTLTVFDEVHHLPAPTFIKLATIRTKYRMGLSASPYREDGKECYIFALSGYPVSATMKELSISPPDVVVYVVRSWRDKVSLLEELLKDSRKTVVFCDTIHKGTELSRRLGIPFVHGKTRDRMSIIQSSDVVIVSRVGDEGISLPEVERVIEVDFLGGSRMQESQRFGRLMHSRKSTQHVVIMTEMEYRKFGKRLLALKEKGVRVKVDWKV